ncbi:DUF397 domain-containing protein [Embleya sp. NPDC050154]|uniref:DUF397 domain-containing protein n=1 Tax=unclassified Embleya TaxID=2699296 RepID=UPI00378A3D6C
MNETPIAKAAAWRKSTYSNGGDANCVEVAVGVSGVVPVRDSKDVRVGHLLVPSASWAALTAALTR